MSTRHVEDIIPWHTNGTLDAAETTRVEEHLAQCGQCRASAQLEAQLVRLALERREPVDLAAQFGWSRLVPLLGAQAAASGSRVSGGRAWSIGRGKGRRSFAAVLIGQAAALVLLAVAIVHLSSMRDARYITLTDAVPEDRSGRATLRLVVAPDTTNEAFQALLEQVGASIRSGPSERGVYTLQLQTPPAAAVEWLRQQPEVRFVEEVQAQP